VLDFKKFLQNFLKKAFTMAIFSLHCSPVGRKQKKSSAVEAAAYQARETIYDRVTGKTYSASPDKYGLCIFADILSPYDAPIWARAKDRKEIWSQAEEIDTRINSRYAKSYILALPHELTILENQRLLKRFLIKNFLSRGLLVDYAIHAANEKGDKRNIHAHILVSTRTITTGMGFGGKDREIDKKKFLKKLREDWADTINNALAMANIKERVSHLSLEVQGLNKIPQQHQGQAATALKRKGEEPDRLKYREYEWGEITYPIGISIAKKIIAASPENELKNSLLTAVKNVETSQAETVEKISPATTIKTEQKEKEIEIIEPTTRKESVRLMINEMDDSLNEKLKIILAFKEKTSEYLEWNGKHNGLEQVKVECEKLYNKMTNDLKPFATLSEQIKTDVIEKKKQYKNPTSLIKGLLRGLIEGRRFIKKLLSRPFTDDDENTLTTPSINDEEKATKKKGRDGR
jgi:hypothetical protein